MYYLKTQQPRYDIRRLATITKAPAACNVIVRLKVAFTNTLLLTIFRHFNIYTYILSIDSTVEASSYSLAMIGQLQNFHSQRCLDCQSCSVNRNKLTIIRRLLLRPVAFLPLFLFLLFFFCSIF